MASERQIAANRRNARKSSGPRSAAGKKRASRNSYRHGLTATIVSNAERARRIEKLAREIAGNTGDQVVLECARAAAQAEFEVAHFRRVKVAMIERISSFGQLASPDGFQSTGEIMRFLSGLGRDELNIPPLGEAAPNMPSTEPERTDEAVRRALPELLKLARYERRAAARRQHALQAIHDINN
jgi:hypothetical protein